MKSLKQTSERWNTYTDWLKAGRQVQRGVKANWRTGRPLFHINDTKPREGWIIDFPRSYIERCKALEPDLNRKTLQRKYKKLIKDNPPADEAYEEDFYMMGDYITDIGDR